MTLQRILASAALVAALAAAGVVFLGGSSTERHYHMHFAHAGLLVKGGEVQIGGQHVGTVSDVGLTASSEADVTVAVDRPLRLGTSASLEEPSLSGQANRYVAINPGPDNAPQLPDGSTIDSSLTTSVVELDELYNLLDPRTRDGLRGLIRGQASIVGGREPDVRRFYATFAPAVQATDRLWRALEGDGASLKRFLSATGRLATTLRASSSDLYGAVEESAAAVGGFARAGAPLRASLRAFPGALTSGRAGLAQLRASLPAFGAAIVRGRADLAELPRFAGPLTSALNADRSLAPLAALMRSPGATNDLTELLAGMPALSGRALPAFGHASTALRAGAPLADQFRAYTPDIVAGWGNTGRAIAPYDANGHYARILPEYGALSEQGNLLVPIPASEKAMGPQTGLLRRCPGSVSQAPADGSAPVAVAGLQCDMSGVPPGP